MKEILILVDYKGYFGTKRTAVPYRSGMNLKLITKYFLDYQIYSRIILFSDVNFRVTNEVKDKIVLYTSSEDYNNVYKSYIEDIVYGLTLAGAKIIPPYYALKAHNNKVFMEILRDLFISDSISSKYYGAYEEMLHHINNYKTFPLITKPSAGSMSKGVSFVGSKSQLIRKVKKLTRNRLNYFTIKDYLRKYIHKGYLPESRFRNKYIVQSYISGISFDWKILIFGKKYYVLKRYNRKNDFRASGSGKLTFEGNPSDSLLNYAEHIFKLFNVPFISLDIGYKNNEYFLFEFQFIYFGTYTIEYAKYYHTKIHGKWEKISGKSLLEEEYVKSIVEYIE